MGGQYFKRAALVLVQWWKEPIGVAVPLFALFIVLFAPQMPDMFAAAGWGLGVAAALLGFSAWYWTRAALLAPLKIDDAARAAKNAGRRAAKQPYSDEEWAREWAPRIALLAALVIALAPAAVAPAAWPYVSWWNVVSGVAWVVAAFLIVLCRQRLRLPRARAPQWMWRYRVTKILAAAPFGWLVAVVLVALTAAGSWIVAEQPQIVELVAAPSAAITALALVIPPLVLALALFRSAATWLVFLGRALVPWVRGEQVTPFTRSLVPGDVFGLLALVLWLYLWPTPQHRYELRPGTGLNASDWHKCQPDEPAYAPRADARPCIVQAVQIWQQKQYQAGYPKDQKLPVVIVAVEGGASRSAAWLLSALRLLDSETGNRFGRYFFAISGVSGGSLGAVTYALSEHQYSRSNGGVKWGEKPVLAGVERLAEGDLLSASIATYFLNDTLARLFRPVWSAPDRGVALELAFERAWQQSSGLTIPRGVAEGDLLALYADRPDGPPLGLPHLLLNGTDEETGRRLITSTIRFHPDDDLFAASDDVLSTHGQDVHLSTAVTNSARFPYISPPGRITGSHWNILDGGYFENYGARTAADLARKIIQISDQVVPVVVVVSNDADTDRARDPATKTSEFENETVSCAHWAPNSLETATARNAAGFAAGDELVAPIIGLYAVRGAHGQDALQLLRRGQCPKNLIHIALPRPIPPDEAAPLNWALNGPTRHFLLDDAPCLPFNQAQAHLLAEALDEIIRKRPTGTTEAVTRVECPTSPPGAPAKPVVGSK